MFDHDAHPLSLEDLVIYESDEVIFDGSDPSTYVVCDTPEDVHQAFNVLLSQS